VLASLDESTYKGGTMGRDHPIAWCRKIGKGRVWYTALGHTSASYMEPLFLEHLLGGIRLAAGVSSGDFNPK
jgi:type 1 glutamine amidotransferase